MAANHAGLGNSFFRGKRVGREAETETEKQRFSSIREAKGFAFYFD